MNGGNESRSTLDNLECQRCGVRLEISKTQFSYLGHSFHADVPACPVCGQVFIAEALANGRIAEVEISLEDK